MLIKVFYFDFSILQAHLVWNPLSTTTRFPPPPAHTSTPPHRMNLLLQVLVPTLESLDKFNPFIVTFTWHYLFSVFDEIKFWILCE